MDLVTGALGKLPGKLLELLKDEYKLQKSVRLQVEFLSRELESMYVSLSKVAQVPTEQLDPQVRLWSSDVREASYDMEDVLDTFLVRVDGGSQPSTDANKLKRLMNKMGKLFNLSKLKARHDIAGAIEGIKKQLEEMTLRRDRYKVDDVVAKPATISIDPLLSALYTKTSQLVGMEGPTDQLVKMLSLGVGDDHKTEKKIVSIVGFGGLGKTTLAKVVHDKLKSDFDDKGTAFVSVGRNPDLKKLFRDILIDLDKERCSKFNLMILDEKQLINEIHEFLKNKRYFIVIDDIWDVSLWEKIQYSLVENNLGCKIIITTRNREVAEKIGSSIYNMKPLSDEISGILFYGRIFGSREMCPEEFSIVSAKIMKKCGGVPLAICTISSLLANKKENIADWDELCGSIGSGLAKDPSMEGMRKIMSLSYYDLPSHLKTCLLYLSIFPEDFDIRVDRLIFRWMAEDFIKQVKTGDNLYEIGYGYFIELVNRSMIQFSENITDKDDTCRVHDAVLDLICSLAKYENFVTLSHDIEQNTSQQSKVRRLSLQKTTGATSCEMSHVRSFTIFSPAIDSMPMLSSFHALRVLDMEDCDLKDHNLSYVGSLVQLRYLGLRGTKYAGDLPKDLGKLQFLQTLDLRRTQVNELPASIMWLKRLMILRLDWNMRLPSGTFRNVTALEELSVRMFIESTNFVEELGGLRNLRKLEMNLEEADQSSMETLVPLLCCMQKLRKLIIYADSEINMEDWAPPQCLCEFTARGLLHQLPTWLSAPCTPQLVNLIIVVQVMRQQDVDALGRLPSLKILCLDEYKVATGETLTVNSGMFPGLTMWRSEFISIVPVFRRGSAPRLRDILFDFSVREMMDAWNGSLDFGLENLGCLEKFAAYLHDEDATLQERDAVVEGLRRARDTHPNGATFDVRFIPGLQYNSLV